MKTISICLLLGFILLQACKKNDDEGCIEPIVLGEVFTTQFNCSYRLINGTDTINIVLTDITDNRSLGGECIVSTGGFANTKLLVNNTEVELISPGCGGDTEPNINDNSLPTFQIDSLKLRLIKVYPLSKDINVLPESEEYRIRLVIL